MVLFYTIPLIYTVNTWLFKNCLYIRGLYASKMLEMDPETDKKPDKHTLLQNRDQNTKKTLQRENNITCSSPMLNFKKPLSKNNITKKNEWKTKENSLKHPLCCSLMVLWWFTRCAFAKPNSFPQSLSCYSCNTNK